ncbi:MAG: hypothetical protein ACRCTA_02880 [Bacilli bacterium]
MFKTGDSSRFNLKIDELAALSTLFIDFIATSKASVTDMYKLLAISNINDTRNDNSVYSDEDRSFVNKDPK